MSNDTSFQFVKLFLRAQSDRTFLSSISYIDFERKQVAVKPRFWKTLIGFMANKLGNPSPSLRRFICSFTKRLFLERFSEVSASSLKKFMLNEIKNYFIDFKNMLYYMHEFIRNGKPKKKNMKKLRLAFTYEKKAKKHYERYINTISNVLPSTEPINFNIPSDSEPDDIYSSHESDNILDEIMDAQSESIHSDSPPPSTPPEDIDRLSDNSGYSDDGRFQDAYDSYEEEITQEAPLFELDDREIGEEARNIVDSQILDTRLDGDTVTTSTMHIYHGVGTGFRTLIDTRIEELDDTADIDDYEAEFGRSNSYT